MSMGGLGTTRSLYSDSTSPSKTLIEREKDRVESLEKDAEKRKKAIIYLEANPDLEIAIRMVVEDYR